MIPVKFKNIVFICLIQILIVVLALQEIKKPSDVYEEFWSDPANPEIIRSTTFETTKKIIDNSVDPCDDFYEYACGNWDTLNPVPDDFDSYNVILALQQRIDYTLKEILLRTDNQDENSSSSEENVAEKQIKYSEAEIKVKNYVKSCMNTEKIQQNSQRSAINFLEQLHGWNISELEILGDQFDWLNLTAYLNSYGGNFVLSSAICSGVEEKHKILHFIAGGNFQFDDHDRYNFTNDGEKNHFYYMYSYYIKSVFKRMGVNVKNLDSTINNIIDFEVEFVNLYPSKISKWDDNNTLISLEDLNKIAPEVDWQRYVSLVRGRPAEPTDKVLIVSEEYMVQLAAFLSKSNPKTIGMYLFFMMSAHIEEMWTTNIYEKQRHRVQKIKEDRFTKCLMSSHEYMGRPLTTLFARHFFDDSSKQEIEEIMAAIKSEFYDFINITSWIDEQHKEFAFTKLDTMKEVAGHNIDDLLSDDSINEEYSLISIKKDKFLDNVIALTQLKTKNMYQRVGQYWDESKSVTEPFEVNAYYGGNKILFPMAILNPPFYHKYAPNWFKYGGIGSIIGHEMVHGFDSNNVILDGDHNRHDITNLKVIGKYYARSVCMSQQYSKYRYNETNRNVDGSQTLSENISDNGGTILALDAYRKWLIRNPDQIENEKIPGLDLSPEQLFFIAHAQAFCETFTLKSILQEMASNVHAPLKFRIIGTVSNSDSFSTAFNCPFAAPMNPVRKCKYN